MMAVFLHFGDRSGPVGLLRGQPTFTPLGVMSSDVIELVR